MSETTENTTTTSSESASDNIVKTENQPKVHEVSAATVARMMGVATNSDLKVLEGKIDLLTGRLHNQGIRIDKILTQITAMPTGSDLERIDVQIGALRTLIKDLMLKELTNSDIKAAFDKSSQEVKKKVESIPSTPEEAK